MAYSDEAKPPSSSEALRFDDFPSLAFGTGTAPYHLFLQALVDGLLEYEAGKGGIDYATTTLPAA